MAWRDRARRLISQALAVWFIARDARTPWWVRMLALLVAGYAFSPIDLIPDAIPVLGLLDDLLLVPLGVMLVLRMTPEHIVADAQRQAASVIERPRSRVAAVLVVLIWLLLLLLLLFGLMR